MDGVPIEHGWRMDGAPIERQCPLKAYLEPISNLDGTTKEWQ